MRKTTVAIFCLFVVFSVPLVSGDWKNMVSFQIDITGPDSGIGFDMDDQWAGTPAGDSYENDQVEFTDGDKALITNLYWQGMDVDNFEWDKTSSSSDVGNTLDEHYPQLCGDDQKEYLLEEMGESNNSERKVGRYACAVENEYCVYRGVGGRKIFRIEESVNTQEPGESEGRLKNDDEICAQRPGLENTGMSPDYDPVPQWYDQDYVNKIEINGGVNMPNTPRSEIQEQNVCRENTLYGEIGVRWLNKDYIQAHPHAVTGGIDDSWNPRFEQMNHPSLESRPDKNTYAGNVVDNGITPVDTGTLGDKVADPTSMDYGLCAGDDASEYLIYQKSQTRFLETENNVLGASSDPDSCVLENSQLDNSDEERRLYEEGERVEFEVGDGSKQQIACYGGAWWGDWPVVFLEDEETVNVGETRYSSFRVINPEASTREFDLTLNIGNERLDQLTTFASTDSNEMNVTLDGRDSRTFDIEIRGNREITPKQEIELQGESRRGDLEGFDTLNASITGTAGGGGSSQGQTRDVPGLKIIQLVVMSLIGTAAYYFTN